MLVRRGELLPGRNARIEQVENLPVSHLSKPRPEFEMGPCRLPINIFDYGCILFPGYADLIQSSHVSFL